MYLEGLFHIGVFCREEVPKGARFGPFTGRIVHRDELDIRFDNTFTWEVRYFCSVIRHGGDPMGITDS